MIAGDKETLEASVPSIDEAVKGDEVFSSMLSTLKEAEKPTVREVAEDIRQRLLAANPNDPVTEVLRERSAGEAIGSGRQQLMQALENEVGAWHDSFNAMTPEQRAIGRVVAMLLASNDDANQRGVSKNEAFEDAFTWFEKDQGRNLTNRERSLVIFQALMNKDINDPAIYRTLRKMFIVVNNTD